MNAPERVDPDLPREPLRALPAGDGRLARGEDSRSRLRAEALRLFAERGFAQTSTREICTAAGVNVAAIHYYFGDKAGLYRDVYLVPIQQMMRAAITLATSDAPVQTVLRHTYEAFLAPLKVADPQTIWILKIYFREQADPTGLVGDQVVAAAREHFDAIVAIVVRELALDEPDDDVRRLAICLIAIAADFLTGSDWNRRLAPLIYAGPDAIDQMVDRLTGYGLAMVVAERTRRAAARLAQA